MVSNIGSVSFYTVQSLTISGTIQVESGIANKKLHVIDINSGSVLAETYSDESGYFEIEGIPLDSEIDIIVHYWGVEWLL